MSDYTVRVKDLKLPYNHGPKAIEAALKSLLKVASIGGYRIIKQSLDARKKQQLMYLYQVEVTVHQQVVIDHKKTFPTDPQEGQYTFALMPKEQAIKALAKQGRPVVIGTGPAGLFCAYQLALMGLRPLVFERGEAVADRMQTINQFFATGLLNPNSNIQFGEGGAGTYSDGKLSTGIKDPLYRKDYVLQVFHQFGADGTILYSNKPHIGTDQLRGVVIQMRKAIEALGGQVYFKHQLMDLKTEGEGLCLTLHSLDKNESLTIRSHQVVLAIGHSARDTFQMLHDSGVPLAQKAFAIGVRIEHPQTMMDISQYGTNHDRDFLPPADYKVTYRTKKGRGVYSFCMCPGGYVVNSSSEAGHVVCNGMSYHKRDGVNANSALLVNVTPEDFGSDHPLGGVAFQRRYEALAYRATGATMAMPVQTVGDFLKGQEPHAFGQVQPAHEGFSQPANLSNCLPDFVIEALKEALPAFERSIKGFARADALLTGVETRSSSPVRILRGETLESAVKGLYPCGEGAGYAGGIMSSAIDGIKVAENIGNFYYGNSVYKG